MAVLSTQTGLEGISLRLGNGDGTFKTGADLVSVSDVTAQELLAIDINDDGKLDLIHADQTRTYRFLGNGDGTFGARTQITANGGSAAAATDYDEDGDIDLVIARRAGGGFVRLRGNGDGTFSGEQLYLGSGNARDIELEDVNNDGVLDAIVNSTMDSTTAVHLSAGSGSFSGVFTIDASTREILAGDFDGDSNSDVLIMSASGIRLSLGNGDGSFQAPAGVQSRFTDLNSMTAADVNSDVVSC